MEPAKYSMILDMVKRTRPGAFIDGRLTANPENAIVYRSRQAIVEDIMEVPMLYDFGIFNVSAIMSGRTQVGICVRFGPKVKARVTQGDHASFQHPSVSNGNLGVAKTAMRTNDFLVFDYSSRGALLIKKLTSGRGYG